MDVSYWDNLIKNADKSKMVRSIDGLKYADTPIGIPLLQVCVYNCSESNSDQWFLEDCFDVLVEQGFDVNCRDREGELLPIYALKNDRIRAFKKIFLRGADLNKKNNLD